MWFRCSGGNGTGGGATITVTYSSQFYNKTMTCTKGTKTYTKTTTSSGSTVFDVDESGTWTITCNGTSRTVDVVLEYSTQMAITKTITVYSAASDTVSFTDVTGAKTVTTNTSGRGSVSITFIPPSANITFTSSKAKNPNNLSQAYSKTVTISTNTTAIYVMPSNVLYWWGYQSDKCEELSNANGWNYGFTYQSPTYNTNDVFVRGGSNIAQGIGSKYAINGTTYNHLKYIVKSNNYYGGAGVVLGALSTKGGTTWTVQESPQSISSPTLVTVDISSYASNFALFWANGDTNRYGALNAFWYE